MSRIKPETTTAIVNGLLVLVVPLAYLAWSQVADEMGSDIARPPGASAINRIVERLAWAASVLLPFAALTAWRTRTYARKVIAGASEGWWSVAEVAACGAAVILIMGVPGVPSRPLGYVPVLILWALTVGGSVGAFVGVILRFTGLLVLWSVQRPLYLL